MDHQPNPSTTPTEVPLAFTCGGDRLAGSLHLPAGPGPFPAVVMAQGSGPADRDSGGYFGPIRATFLDRGLATFAFDKPGCGRSSGDWRRHGLSDRAEQIVAGLAAVRTHPAIDGERVGIWGHSQGGWLVQMLAGRRLPLAFAVAGSAPTITVREQILHDVAHTLADLGHDDEAVDEALAFATALHGAADDGRPFDEVRHRLLDPAAGRPWFDDVPTADDAADWEHLRRLIGEPFEPTAALRCVACPFLAVYGGLDLLLPPWRGAQETGQALAEAATTDATVLVMPLGDHRLQDPDTGAFVDGYLDLLGRWASRRVG